MKIYMWYTEYNSDYQKGQAVVIANSVDEARIKLIEAYKIEEDCDEGSDDYDYDFARFIEDLSEKPEISDYLFVYGGS